MRNIECGGKHAVVDSGSTHTLCGIRDDIGRNASAPTVVIGAVGGKVAGGDKVGVFRPNLFGLATASQ